MKIYQKSGDKNVGANIVYVVPVGLHTHMFATEEDAKNPIVDDEILVNGIGLEEAKERFMAGNMMLCELIEGEDIPAFEFASGFEPGNGYLYSGNLEAYCKEMYEPVESDENPVR